MEKSWFALYTKSRAEKKVQLLLDKLGIVNYLPLRKMERQWSDRKKIVEMPLINSYIFIKIDPLSVNSIYNIPGIVGFVNDIGQRKSKVVIPDHEIELMRKAIDAPCEIEVCACLQKGVEVIFKEGPFAGQCGEVIEIQGKKRIAVRLNQLGFVIVLKDTFDNLMPQ